MPITPESLATTLRTLGYREREGFEVAAILEGEILVRWGQFDAQDLERSARWLSRHEGRANLYVLANPINPNDRRRGRAREQNCVRKETLLIDLDPEKVRQKDVEAGLARPEDLDELGIRPDKLEAAELIAAEILELLQDRLGVRPARVFSGRGHQIWLRHEPVPSTVRRRLVRALARRYDRPGLACVDPATHNAARLVRLPGARNLRSGMRARILDPGDGQLAPAEKMVALVEELDPPPKARPLPPGRSKLATQARGQGGSRERVLSALDAIPADQYETWVQVGMALAASGLEDAYELWDRWSSTSTAYDGPDATRAKWRSFSPDGGITLGTLFALALQHGWRPPAPTREQEALLPLVDSIAPARATSSPEQARELVRSVVRARRRRRDSAPPPVVQDRRPTGAGKTTGAARELVEAARELDAHYLWASPSHELARLEVLPALARAGAVVWDLDLEDQEDETRGRILAAGGRILPVGQTPPGEPEAVTAAKLPRFSCPGPAVEGWTPEHVEELYAAAAARGWNPASTVCRACPRFLREAQDPCPYWRDRKLAAEADVVVAAHHSAGEGSSAAEGRRAMVLDEDPTSALLRRHEIDEQSVRIFCALLARAEEHALARAHDAERSLEAEQERKRAGEWSSPRRIAKLQRRQERGLELAQEVVAQREAAEAALLHLAQLVSSWHDVRSGELEVAYELPCPSTIQPQALQDLEALSGACERVLAEIARTGDVLRDDRGQPVGSPANLLSCVAELGRLWLAGKPAVLHAQRREGGALCAVLPSVERLPEIPILALDATGDPTILALATGREVQALEGEATASLTGVHLADVPCGRRRWKRKAGRRQRSGQEALAADASSIVRHARRVGARRVGIVTFQAAVEPMTQALERAGLEVRSLHYGAEVGSNAFADWADQVVVAGTPYVPPEEVRVRAALEGASVEELRTEPQWDLRRLPSGGVCPVLVQPGPASARAYGALVRSRLEQALGRALRWDWVPPCGVLVLAEPWPTRHRLRLTTRSRECLEGPGAGLEDLAQKLGDQELLEAIRSAARSGRQEDSPSDAIQELVRQRVAAAGGAEQVASATGLEERTVRRWIDGDRLPEPEEARRLWRACPREDKDANVSADEGPPGGRGVGPEMSQSALSVPESADCDVQSADRDISGPPPSGTQLGPRSGNVAIRTFVGQNAPLCAQKCGSRHFRTDPPPLGGVRSADCDISQEGSMAKKRAGPALPGGMSVRDLVDCAMRSLNCQDCDQTVEGLARHLKVSIRTIASWRSGERVPRRDKLQELLRIAEPAVQAALRREPLDHEAARQRARGGTWHGDERVWHAELAVRLAGDDVPFVARRTGYTARTVYRWLRGYPEPRDRAWLWIRRLIVELRQDPEAMARIEDEADRQEILRVWAPDLGEWEETPEQVLERRRRRREERRRERERKAGEGEQEQPSRRPPRWVERDPVLTARDETCRGLREIREWEAMEDAQGWLVRAVRRAKALGSLATWCGIRRAQDADGYEVDEELGLARAQAMQEITDQPLYARRMWAHVARELIERGADPRAAERIRRRLPPPIVRSGVGAGGGG